MRLLHSDERTVSPGKYNVKMDMSSGDARLQWQAEGGVFQDIPDTVKTSSTGFNVDLPGCRVQSLITGDATVILSEIRR